VAGVAGLSCAKLRPLKAKLVKAITKTLIMFFTVSPPSSLVRRDIPKLLQIFTEKIIILRCDAQLKAVHNTWNIELN